MFKATGHFFNLFVLFFCMTGFCANAVSPDSPIDISTTLPSIIPADQSQIAIDNNGNAVAIWREYDSESDITYIRSAAFSKFTGWTPPLTLSFVGGNDIEAKPQIAVGSITGNAVAVWAENNAGVSTVKGAQLPFGLTWGAPKILSPASSTVRRVPYIAINDLDYAVAVWRHVDATSSIHCIQSAQLQFGGDWSLSSATVVSSHLNYEFPKVGVDAAGNAVAVWQNFSTSANIESATLAYLEETWIPATLPGNSYGIALSLDLAVHPSGYAVATWTNFDSLFGYDRVRVSIFNDGAWSLPVSISSGAQAQNPSVAIDSAKGSIVVWSQAVGSNLRIKSCTSPFPGASWSSPIDISKVEGFAIEPDVAFDEAGNAYAVWTRSGLVEFATLPVGTNLWSSPVCIVSAPNSQKVHIAVDSTGPGFAVMDWRNNTGTVIQATQFPPLPTVTNVSPNKGSTSGGNRVVITGTNFTDVVSVEFGFGSFATILSVISPTQILVLAPPHAEGPVDVIVTRHSGSSRAATGNGYTFQTPVCWQR